MAEENLKITTYDDYGLGPFDIITQMADEKCVIADNLNIINPDDHISVWINHNTNQPVLANMALTSNGTVSTNISTASTYTKQLAYFNPPYLNDAKLLQINASSSGSLTFSSTTSVIRASGNYRFCYGIGSESAPTILVYGATTSFTNVSSISSLNNPYTSLNTTAVDFIPRQNQTILIFIRVQITSLSAACTLAIRNPYSTNNIAMFRSGSKCIVSNGWQ